MGQVSVFVLWQSLVIDAYRSFFAYLASHTGMRVGLAAPRVFIEGGNQRIACEPPAQPFYPADEKTPFYVLDAWTAHVQIVVFPRLGRALRSFFKQKSAKSSRRVFLCIAEPYSPTALLAWIMTRVFVGRDILFYCYAAQNIVKRYPFVLRKIQSFLFMKSAAILAVGDEQAAVLHAHGYNGTIIPFPLWFDQKRFSPDLRRQDSPNVTVGFAGGLTEAKGIADLLAAFGCRIPALGRQRGAPRHGSDHCDDSPSPTPLQQPMPESSLAAAPAPSLLGDLTGNLSLRIAGAGPLLSTVEDACMHLRRQQVDAQYLGALPVDRMPDFYRALDILVVPSRTTTAWKEQFGRVIVEAMACGVVVIGSRSGEIPRVIGRDERLFEEANPASLAKTLANIVRQLSSVEKRPTIRQAEAKRALANYSDQILAKRFAEWLAHDVQTSRSRRGSN